MIKFDVVMCAIWIAISVVLCTLNIGLTMWQYWAVGVGLVAVEYRATYVAKKGLK